MGEDKIRRMMRRNNGGQPGPAAQLNPVGILTQRVGQLETRQLQCHKAQMEAIQGVFTLLERLLMLSGFEPKCPRCGTKQHAVHWVNRWPNCPDESCGFRVGGPDREVDGEQPEQEAGDQAEDEEEG